MNKDKIKEIKKHLSVPIAYDYSELGGLMRSVEMYRRWLIQLIEHMEKDEKKD